MTDDAAEDTQTPPASDATAGAVFRAPYAPPDEAVAAQLFAEAYRPACGRCAHRYRGDPVDRRHSCAVRRARGRRGLPACLFPVHQGGARPHGAGRGALAGARRHDGRSPDRGQARRRRLGVPRIGLAPGLGVGLDAGSHRPRHSSGRNPRLDPGQPGPAAWHAGGAGCDAPGDAAPRLPFRARADDRGGAATRGPASRPAVFLRYAGRGRADGGRRPTLSRRLCARHRRDRRERGRGGLAGPAGDFGQALRAPSALRGGVARPRDGGTRAAGHRTRPRGPQIRSQSHLRRRGGRPSRTQARRDRWRCSPTRRCAAGRGWGSPCRPTRSARRR